MSESRGTLEEEGLDEGGVGRGEGGVGGGDGGVEDEGGDGLPRPPVPDQAPLLQRVPGQVRRDLASPLLPKVHRCGEEEGGNFDGDAGLLVIVEGVAEAVPPVPAVLHMPIPEAVLQLGFLPLPTLGLSGGKGGTWMASPGLRGTENQKPMFHPAFFHKTLSGEARH